MLVRIWGCRGSLPVATNTGKLRARLIAALQAAQGRKLASREEIIRFMDAELDFAVTHSFGGNTSCVEIESGGSDHVACDLGSGAREFGNSVLAGREPGKPGTFHFFLSHLHWDHIMGFPFFAPAYLPGNRIYIYGCHSNLEEGFQRQQHPHHFPVQLSQMAADIRFVRLETGVATEAAGFRVTPKLQQHSGDSYGYRFEKDGKAIVYSTDSEHKLEQTGHTQTFVEFFRDADLVLFDAMYSLADTVSVKKDWGHSSNIVGVELCQMAGAKHLCLFHHEPIYGDDQLETLWRDSQRLEEITRSGRPLRISSACDGMEILV
ncbi:MAG: MBL fold metallo-hydrolase [Nitrosomonadales bacterium]|nr:MBL fold metallo-hydrolase [Nitrosomonadales bacterium]